MIRTFAFSLALLTSLAACSPTSVPRPDAQLVDARQFDEARRLEGPSTPAPEAGLDHGLTLDAAARDLAAKTDLAAADSRPPLPKLPVLVLAGQSNMVGLGYNAELSAADKALVTSTTIYYNDGVHSNPKAEQWKPLGPGFGVAADRFGPELSFGRRLRQLWPQPPLAIIKVAEGATALHDRWAAKSGDLYKLLVLEVKQQLAVLNATTPAGVVGVVWMQGESDGIQAGYASAYQANLTAFVKALRQDLGLPSLPFTAGLISLRPEWPHATTVRAGTVAAAAALAPMNVVETADLPTHPADPVHYNSASNLALGRRFAGAMASHHATGWSFALGFSPVQGSAAWRYRDRQGTAVLPMTWDPKQNRWAGSEGGVLIGEGWMHPGPNRSAELTWTAPFTGAFTVELTVTPGDTTGGDGTVVEVAQGAATVWGPTPIVKTGSGKQSLKLTLPQGSLLQFRTSAGPAGDPLHDTTLWTISITPTSP